MAWIDDLTPASAETSSRCSQPGLRDSGHCARTTHETHQHRHPCYNEEDNVEERYRRVKELFASLGKYRYEHIFIDNASTDRTRRFCGGLAAEDKNVKVIVNSRNFGHIRSPYHAVLQARGDAVIPFVADLQEPLELIAEFLQKWEAGHKIVMGVKVRSSESPARCSASASSTIAWSNGCRKSS